LQDIFNIFLIGNQSILYKKLKTKLCLILLYGFVAGG